MLLIVGVIWVASGLIALFWMTRRGHRDPRWLVLAILLGPIFAAVAPERGERGSRLLDADRPVDDPESPHYRIVIGVDGSPEAERALQLTLELLGANLCTLILVRVVDFDTADADVDAEDDDGGAVERTKAELERRAWHIHGHTVGCAVLAGAPADAILGFAEETRADLIVIGRHGSGFSKRLMGNVSQSIVRRAAVPVLVAGDRPMPNHESV
jgi:nucleotide-binding universal stress UspA family protein